MSVLGTDMEDPSKLPFHGLEGSTELRIHAALRTFTLFSSLRDSECLSAWLTSAYPQASGTWLALPRVPPWHRNINRLPYPQARLGLGLGLANCRLTNIAGKPLAFRWPGFSPGFAATFARIFFPTRSSGTHVPPSARAGRLPTSAFALRGIGSRLSPLHFRGSAPRRVSCFAVNCIQTFVVKS